MSDPDPSTENPSGYAAYFQLLGSDPPIKATFLLRVEGNPDSADPITGANHFETRDLTVAGVRACGEGDAQFLELDVIDGDQCWPNLIQVRKKTTSDAPISVLYVEPERARKGCSSVRSGSTSS